MINNDPRRSIDFFKSPINAGREARALPFDWSQILALHGLRAIILALGSYFAFLVLPERVNSEVDPESYQLFLAIEAMLSGIYSSPLMLFFIGWFSGLLMTSFLWQIGRAVGHSDVGWLEAQSALIRYLLVTAVISTIIGALSNLTGFAIFAMLNFAVSIYFLVNFLQVLRGVLELSSFLKSLWVGFLSVLAMFGVAYLISMMLVLVN